MSHDHIEKPTDITVPPTSMWAKLPMIGGAMAVVGLGVTFGMFATDGKVRALFAYLWSFEFWLSIALGGLGFVCIQHAVRAGWSTVVRRLAENVMMTLPVFIPLFLVVWLIGLKELFPWTWMHDENLARKRWFLSEGPWIIRAAIYFAIWSVMSWLLYSWSTKQDAAKTEDERDSFSKKMWTLSAPGIALYALTQTFQAVDWMKSLSPHWYSTMWGVYYFAGSILAFYAFITLVAAALQRAGVLKKAINKEHYHDLGKFMFGHCIFWAYIAFSQFMLHWYGNMPDETEWWIHRIHGGWAPISYALPIVHFGIPFLMILSRHVKRSRIGIQICAVWFLVVHAIDHYWIILPNFTGAAHVANMAKGEAEHAANGAASEVVSQFAPHFVDFFAFLGVAGVFLAAFGFFLNRHKVICINDPRLEESLKHENY